MVWIQIPGAVGAVGAWPRAGWRKEELMNSKGLQGRDRMRNDGKSSDICLFLTTARRENYHLAVRGGEEGRRK